MVLSDPKLNEFDSIMVTNLKKLFEFHECIVLVLILVPAKLLLPPFPPQNIRRIVVLSEPKLNEFDSNVLGNSGNYSS